jgi:hypothetical protein
VFLEFLNFRKELLNLINDLKNKRNKYNVINEAFIEQLIDECIARTLQQSFFNYRFLFRERSCGPQVVEHL